MFWTKSTDKKHKVLTKVMNISFEEKHRFINVMGEILIPAELRDVELPTVICIPDEGKSYVDSKKIAGKLFAQKRYRTYCFDFNEMNTENNKSFLSYEEKVKCIVEIIKRFKKSKYTKEIFLLGIGKGAGYADSAANKIADTISGLIFYYPQFTINVLDAEFLEECYQEDKNIDTYNYVSKYQGPVLIVYGEKDKCADLIEYETILDCYQNAELNILEKEPHEFTCFGRKKARDLSCEFVNKIIHRL